MQLRVTERTPTRRSLNNKTKEQVIELLIQKCEEAEEWAQLQQTAHAEAVRLRAQLIDVRKGAQNTIDRLEVQVRRWSMQLFLVLDGILVQQAVATPPTRTEVKPYTNLFVDESLLG